MTPDDEAARQLAELQAVQQQRRLTPAELREAAGLMRRLGRDEQARQTELAAARAELDAAAPLAAAAPTFVTTQVADEPVPCGLARPAMVTALVGLLVPCLLPIALLLGLAALVVIACSRGRETGLGHAVAAVVIPLVWMPVIGIVAAIAIPYTVLLHEKQASFDCQREVKRLCVATLQYADAHDGTLPPPGRDIWIELRPYLAGAADRRGHGSDEDEVRYTFNEPLRGRKLSSLGDTAKTELWFESKDGGKTHAYPHLSDHGNDIAVAGYADGHVAFVPAPADDAGDDDS